MSDRSVSKTLFYVIFALLFISASSVSAREAETVERLRIVSLRVPEIVEAGEEFGVSVTVQDPVGIKGVELTLLRDVIKLPARGETTAVLNAALITESAGYFELEAVAVGMDGARGEPESVIIGVADHSVAEEDIRDHLEAGAGELRELMKVSPYSLYMRGDSYKPGPSAEEIREQSRIQLKKDIESDISQINGDIVKLINWWKSWKELGGPQPFDWENQCSSNVTGIEMDGKVLKCWLDLHPQVKQAMVWQEVDPNTGDVEILTYDDWDIFLKNYLNVNFYYYWQWLNGNITNFQGIVLYDPPFNQVQLEDEQFAITALSRYQAANLYIQIVAHSLALEIGGFVPWSVVDYNQYDLERLLSSESMFYAGQYNITNANNPDAVSFIGYWPIEVTPAPPTTTFKFLVEDNILRPTHYDTVSRLLKWGRDNMYHHGGDSSAGNMYKHWQYRGDPPVSLIIKGTHRIMSSGNPEAKAKSWIRGCHGTSFFFREVLRAANIPVSPVWVPMTGGGGHRSPVFTTIGRTLSHGDDVFNVRFNIPSVDPDYLPPDWIMIDVATFITWFNENNPENWDNVGRQYHEIALDILPNKLMDKYCDDLAANKSHASSSVYQFFSYNYTVQELEAMNLWTRLSNKNYQHDFCAEYYINADLIADLFHVLP